MAKFKRSELNLGEGQVWNYNYSYLKNLDDRTLKREYSRLRAIAEKRIKRLGNSEWEWTKAYQSHKQGYLSVDEITRRSDLVKELAELGHFVYGKENSISGLNEIRKRSLEELHFNGYDFVTEENWKEWTEFIDKYKKMWSKGSPTPEMLEMKEDFTNFKNDPKKMAELFNKWSSEIDEIQGPRLKR